jgi:hypothetical protein
LFLRRIETKPKLVDGKVRYVAPIDWKSTKKLWEDDIQAKKNKTLVKFPPGEVFYIKHICNYTLGGKLKFYTFRLLRSVQRGKLKELGMSKAKCGINYLKTNSKIKQSNK